VWGRMTADATLPPRIAHPREVFFDGNWSTPFSDSVLPLTNPATGRVFLEIASANDRDIERAVGSARQAFDDGPWPNMTLDQRAQYLEDIATAVEGRTDEFSRMWTWEVGIVQAAARVRVGSVPATLRRYVEIAREFDFVESHHPKNGTGAAYLVREPVGVVGAIVPWNSPLTLMAHKVAPALLAGCTVVLKAAPEAPGAAYLLAEIAQEVGLPEGVLNVVSAAGPASEALVRDARVDRISFTGSVAVGQRIGAICGGRVGRVGLELGGKSAAIVLSDADLGRVASEIVDSSKHMAAQICAALTRVIVPESHHDEMVWLLCERYRELKLGDPFDPRTDMGPLAMERQRAKVEEIVGSAVEDGCELAIGGKRPQGLPDGYFYEPTVFANVDNMAPIAQKEVFGPVMCVIPSKSDDDAVRIANESEFGLNSSVFTEQSDRAWDVARRLRTGTVGHNGFRLDFGIGFGGFKQSGLGREGGREGLSEYFEAKTVLLDHKPGLVLAPSTQRVLHEASDQGKEVGP
jgi:aldehyde dehydrogenase (NAD+)